MFVAENDHTIVFDNQSRNWMNFRETNRMFIYSQVKYFNQVLNAKGHVFMNDIREAFDVPKIPAGQLVGWLKHSKAGGHITVHINELKSGFELIFNVDGIIFAEI